MYGISLKKIQMMLSVYRERLAAAEAQPIDYIKCIQLSAQIGLLEHLFILARQNKMEE